jgi:hypothetical protein
MTVESILKNVLELGVLDSANAIGILLAYLRCVFTLS